MNTIAIQRKPSGRGAPFGEAELVQNPALGAFLLWRMGACFQQEGSISPRMEHAFLVLPLLLHRPTLNVITKTQTPSGLAHFVSKMHEREEELLAIHSRALQLRELTLQSLTIGMASGILAIDYSEGLVCALDVGKSPELPERLKPMQKAAAKLGIWFARLSLSQTLTMLRVAH